MRHCRSYVFYIQVQKLETLTIAPRLHRRRVSRQILKALGEFGLKPDQVRFSGYDSPDDLEHAKKAQGIDGEGNLDDIRDEDYYDFENADCGLRKMGEVYRETAINIAATRQAWPKGYYTYYFADHTELSDGQDGPLTYATGPTPAVEGYMITKNCVP